MAFSPLLKFHPILRKITPLLPPDRPVYLVGGAVRDAILDRTSKDLDFVVSSGAIALSRKIADAIKGDFYPLDQERDYGRVILHSEGGTRLILDFTPFQGNDIESDLSNRDFTINAIALDLHHSDRLIDPNGGVQDLHSKTIRACSPDAIVSDPVRALRAVRFAANLDFRIDPDTGAQLRKAAPLLEKPSAERVRDELLHIVGGSRPATGIRTLDFLDFTPYLLPELQALKGVTQSAPHVYDVWEHTLKVLEALESLLETLAQDADPETYSNLKLGLVSLQLGRYREQITSQLTTPLTPERTVRPLIFLAALYHDVGKPATRQVDAEGRVRFIDHEKVGSQLVGQRGHALQLSNAEIARLKLIVLNHMRPLWLAQSDQTPSRRAIYRFFRSTDSAGVEICLLSLADTLAIYGPGLSQEPWERILGVARALLEAWWEGPKEMVRPDSLVSGKDLIEELKMVPGPEIGRVLEEIREAQAIGQLANREEALAFAASLLNQG